MSNKNTVSIKLGGFLELLTLLFIGLKLTNYIDWSWWWVLAPTWIPASIVLSILAFVGVVFFIATVSGAKFKIRRKS